MIKTPTKLLLSFLGLIVFLTNFEFKVNVYEL